MVERLNTDLVAVHEEVPGQTDLQYDLVMLKTHFLALRLGEDQLVSTPVL